MNVETSSQGYTVDKKAKLGISPHSLYVLIERLTISDLAIRSDAFANFSNSIKDGLLFEPPHVK